MRVLGGAAISTPIHDDDREVGVQFKQSFFVRSASHTYDELVPTCFCESLLALYLWEFHFDEEPLRPRRMLVEVVCLDFPQRACSEFQRVKVLAIDEHIQAREVVAWNLVGARIMRIVPTTGRPWNGLALGTALSRVRGVWWIWRKPVPAQWRPFRLGLSIRQGLLLRG
jgi:hypothetical protein